MINNSGQQIPSQATASSLNNQASPVQQPKKHRIGFADKTLWDLLTVFLVPLMIGIGTIVVTIAVTGVSTSFRAFCTLRARAA
jgi:hypothetical protein